MDEKPSLAKVTQKMEEFVDTLIEYCLISNVNPYNFPEYGKLQETIERVRKLVKDQNPSQP